MTRYARWVAAHGGWLTAPPEPWRPPNYDSFHFRLERLRAVVAIEQRPHPHGPPASALTTTT